MPKNLRHNTQCGCSDWVGLAQSLCIWSPTKGEAPKRDGDTDGVSATSTPMFKSVRELMSKRRGRVLARKNVRT